MNYRFARSALVCTVLVFLTCPCVQADTLEITSTPPGATVEIDGRNVGKTPYTTRFPSGYFRKPHSIFSKRLEREMVVRISKDGFKSQRITISEGPFTWIGLSGHRHGDYWLLKSTSFEVLLDPVSSERASSIHEQQRAGPIHVREAAAATPRMDVAAEHGTVVVASEREGADVYVDGQFVGQTPATISLTGGSHHLVVRAADGEVWERDVTVLKGSQVSLHPVFKN